MPSYEHKKLAEEIARLNEIPSDAQKYSEWIQADQQIEFLRANARSKEVVIYASAPNTFVHSLVVSNELLTPPDIEDLLKWSGNPYTSAASYVTGGGRDDMWIERGDNGHGSQTLEDAVHLIYARTFEGWSGGDRTYIEASQEYTHLAGIHWRPEHRSYCRYDDNGDLDHQISITVGEKFEDLSLVSFSWEELETYLAVSNSALVRMFDFTLVKYDSFSDWSDEPEEVIEISSDFFFRQKIDADCSYTRGVQIMRPRKTAVSVATETEEGWRGQNKQHVEFTAHDFRNKQITKISTDPAATTNYFQADDNALPFELSPAFFRPEVLLKYKGDREKYSVGERDISSRGGWMLRGFDVNEAGQIHAYICDLRALPHSELLHWLSFNEEPKTGISQRAITNDFEGQWVSTAHPLVEILGLLRRWHKKKTPLWVLRDESLMDAVSRPLTSSKDEWSEAFMDLSKVITEGFQVKEIRARLDAQGVAYAREEQSIALLEKLIGHGNGTIVDLKGLRAIQRIRSKVKGHSGSREAMQIVQQAISEHGSFAKHFESVCALAYEDLQLIDALT